jgi:membrane protein DedA with SNARE-associated domain
MLAFNPLTVAHIACVALIVVCTTILGATGGISSSDATNIFVACLGSLSGHAVGYAAGRDVERKHG